MAPGNPANAGPSDKATASKNAPPVDSVTVSKNPTARTIRVLLTDIKAIAKDTIGILPLLYNHFHPVVASTRSETSHLLAPHLLFGRCRSSLTTVLEWWERPAHLGLRWD